MSIAEVIKFCRDVRKKLDNPEINPARPMIFYTGTHFEVVTNTVFLLCCYMVLEGGMTPDQAMMRFEDIVDLPIAHFCDASFKRGSSYALSVLDCLVGMTKGINLGWIDDRNFDLELFNHLYDEETWDLSVVTSKFVAFSCPNTIDNNPVISHTRTPEEYFGVFKNLGVTDIVRLNDDPFYDDEEFKKAGFKLHDLSFADCSCPSAQIVERFLDVSDSATGRVAVHCLAGLGRTGTLIACHMIKHTEFNAAEAIAYVRLIRPGSIVDQQQVFLEKIEACEWTGNMPVFLRRDLADQVAEFAREQSAHSMASTRREDSGRSSPSSSSSVEQLPSPNAKGDAGSRNVSTVRSSTVKSRKMTWLPALSR